jgi:hypothetical protein
MKKYLIILIFLSVKVSAHPLCDRIQNGIVSYLETPESRVDFKNQGGMLKGGVCWWHARLQRSSAYLIDFKPELAAPASKQLQQILTDLKHMNKVVIIPGFQDFNSFTKAYQNEVQKLLESWQREDGFINQQWVRGISGKYELAPDEMKSRMSLLHEQFLNSPHPMWVMAQIKGISSHAFLILDIIPLADGFELKMIDSNHPAETRVIQYVHGQRFLKHLKEKYSFVPYLGFQKDYISIQSSVTEYCGNILSFESKEIPVGDIELSH